MKDIDGMEKDAMAMAVQCFIGTLAIPAAINRKVTTTQSYVDPAKLDSFLNQCAQSLHQYLETQSNPVDRPFDDRLVDMRREAAHSIVDRIIQISRGIFSI